VKVKDVPPIPGRGFTLVELMACVAIGLMLIVGINQVFRIASQTVGAGQALASAVRDYRAVQPVLYADLSAGALPYATNGTVLDDGPFLLIRSERMTMFRSRADQMTDRDGDPGTTDINGDNVEGDKAVPGEFVRPTDLSERSHRLDRLMFFTRGMFRRQTGGALSSSDGAGSAGGSFAADMTCDEAFVWYGHLKLPDYTTPVADARKYAARAAGERVPPSAPIGST
jgi:prepilin-type N-terminal cleavage/methylation domain-containing protein